MQVEYKTEKGTLLFVKVPDDAFRISLDDKYGLKFKQHSIPAFCFDNVTLPKSNWQLIGLTSEVTEEQAKMMVDSIGFDSGFYKHYSNDDIWCCGAIGSIKSIMQHLQVYEVNPLGAKPAKYSTSYNYLIEEWEEHEKTVGKWIVLFKPNEKL